MNLTEAIIHFAMSYGKFESELKSHSKPADLTPLQFDIILLLMHGNQRSPTDIMTCLNLTFPNTSRELKKLEALNYIVRLEDQHDRRKHYLKISERGARVIDDNFSAAARFVDERFKDLSAEELKRLQQSFCYISGLLQR